MGAVVSVRSSRQLRGYLVVAFALLGCASAVACLASDLPPHMAKAFKLLGFDLRLADDPFAALEP